MSRPITFTKAQVRRAVEAGESTGKRVKGFRITRDGTIEVEFGEPRPAGSVHNENTLAASWDDA